MADYIIVRCSVQCEEFCSDVPCLPSACIRSVTSSLGVQYVKGSEWFLELLLPLKTLKFNPDSARMVQDWLLTLF